MMYLYICICNVSESSGADHSEVEVAGMQLLRMIQGLKGDESLYHHRYSCYMTMLATTTRHLKPERLPPTENSAKFHFHRVHLQVAQWRTLMTCSLNPQSWGWMEIVRAYIHSCSH